MEATATIMKQLYDHYPDLAQQKFSSNVVEKCLKLGGPGLAECRERVIRELMLSPQLPRLLQVGPALGVHLREAVSCHESMWAPCSKQALLKVLQALPSACLRAGSACFGDSEACCKPVQVWTGQAP